MVESGALFKSSHFTNRRVEPDTAFVGRYGRKAAGLCNLPGPWGPPFVIIPVDCQLAWRDKTSRKRKQISSALLDELEEALSSLTDNGRWRVIVRSSATDETIYDRGAYSSRVSDPSIERIVPAMEHVLRDFDQKNPNGSGARLGLIIQRYVEADVRGGHLSNERRVTRNGDRWAIGYEIRENEQFERLSCQSQLAASPHSPLVCRKPTQIRAILRKVAAWLHGQFEERVHVEWCYASPHIWLLQLDFEDDDPGADDPRKVLIDHRESYEIENPSGLELLQQFDQNDKYHWPKLENVKSFQVGDERLPHRIYFVTGERVSRAVRTRKRKSQLLYEIDQVIGRRGVVRTDIQQTDAKLKMNLPRTDGVDATGALRQMTETLDGFRQERRRLSDLCFLLHKYIPAGSSAWSYAEHTKNEVYVDALWGLPDGLQYLPHDTYEIDNRTQKIVSKNVRYKPYFLSEYDDGSWQYRSVTLNAVRKQCLADSVIKDIAKRTKLFAKNLGKPVQVMWFTDIPNYTGLDRSLPWINLSEPEYVPADKRPRGRFFVVRNDVDLDSLKGGQRNIAVIQLQPEATLIRDDKFLSNVIAIARERSLAIGLGGSVLCHAYYQLRKAGLRVFETAPRRRAKARRDRRIFKKLVRDDIPRKIEASGEAALVSQLTKKDLDKALRVKLLEEVIELIKASERGELIEELADVEEVIFGLLETWDIDQTIIQSRAQEKRDKRGGFGLGIMLVETHMPGVAQIGGSQTNLMLKGLPSRKEGKPSFQSPISKDGTAIFPFSVVVEPRSEQAVTVDIPGEKMSVILRVSDEGFVIRIRRAEEGEADTRQLVFKFLEPGIASRTKPRK